MVEATVLDCKRVVIPPATVRFTITYQYSYGGAIYEYRQNVRRSLYEALSPGEKIAVLCLRDDPAIVRIADDLLT